MQIHRTRLLSLTLLLRSATACVRQRWRNSFVLLNKHRLCDDHHPHLKSSLSFHAARRDRRCMHVTHQNQRAVITAVFCCCVGMCVRDLPTLGSVLKSVTVPRREHTEACKVTRMRYSTVPRLGYPTGCVDRRRSMRTQTTPRGHPADPPAPAPPPLPNAPAHPHLVVERSPRPRAPTPHPICLYCTGPR